MERLQELTVWNKQVGEQLQRYGIRKLWMTSYGNSIASGFSMLNPIVPLLYRNVTLEQSMLECNIELERFSFARAQNNNEDHLLRWLIDNISEIEINKMNQADYGDTSICMLKKPVEEKSLNHYFPLDLKNPRRLQDIALTDASDLANLIIYNGATGSLLDNFTRRGKHKNFSAVVRDINGLEAILRIIQDYNRQRGTNTQVYLCGVPNVLGINISELINSKLKAVASRFANVVYVEPVREQFIYFQNGLKVDVHYSDSEYEQMHIKIMKQIYENYFATKIKIEIDRMLFHQSEAVEFGGTSEFLELLEQTLEKAKENDVDLNRFRKDLLGYVLERYPYDYFYLSKKQLVKAIKRKEEYYDKRS